MRNRTLSKDYPKKSWPQFMVGAQYWLVRGIDAELIEKDTRMMEECNLNALRLWFHWGMINPQPGVWDYGLYDSLFEAAARHNIGIAGGFDYLERAPTWLRKERSDIEWEQTDDLRIREYASEFIRRTVQRYKEHPALYAWILKNEPHCHQSFHPLTIERFREWLKDLYDDDIDKLNDRYCQIIAHGQTYQSFDEISITEDTFDGIWKNHALYRDWRDFTIWREADWLSWINKEVKRGDISHPTTINPGSELNRWDLFKSVDIMGSSLHPRHWTRLWPITQTELLVNYVLDGIRSSGKKAGTFWVTEFSAGPGVFSGAHFYTPPPHVIKNLLWNARAAGADTVLFWLWRHWYRSWQGGENGLIDMRGQPSERLAVTRSVMESMKKHESILNNARHVKAQVAIWFSKNNQILAEREYRRGSNQRGPMNANRMCYRALWEANISVDQISTEELLEGIANNYRVIYAPETNHVSPETAKALAEYVEQGGYLWADGIFGWKDDYSKVHEPSPGAGLAGVFGCEIADMNGTLDPSDMNFAGSGKAIPSYEAEIWLHATTGKVIASFDNGRPAIVTNRYGQGTTMYVGTHLCRGLEADFNQDAASLVSDFAYQRIKDSIKVDLDISYGRLRFRHMDGPEGPIVVVSNYGEESGKGSLKVRGSFSKAKELTSCTDCKAEVMNGWSAVSVDIPSNETCVYAFGGSSRTDEQ